VALGGAQISRAASGALVQDFTSDMQQGKTNLVQGIMTCIEIINNELTIEQSNQFHNAAYPISDGRSTADRTGWAQI
jgi:hypothetical protein